MAYDSVTTWRLYAAEQSVGLGTPLGNVQAARALVQRVKRSRWWRDNVPDSPRIRLVVGGEEYDGMQSSYAQPDAESLPSRWLISMHPEMLNDLVVLHELAHCIAPRWLPDPSGRRRRKGYLHNHHQLPVHGEGFAGAMAELVREFGDGAVHDELRDAYDHFGVPALTLDEYHSAVEASRVAEEDVTDLRREIDAERAVQPVPEPPPDGWKVPEIIWGDWLWLMRFREERVGMDRLAAAISPVEKCTRNDVKKIHSSRTLPDDPRLRRIAMCMAVWFGLDPIYMRYRLGLVRWDCGIELDELREINPDWVDLVDEMNRLLHERPPKWVVEGER